MGDLNPYQFGDQLTLFDAPLGQPDRGMTTGNPHARLFRTLHVHNRALGIHNDPYAFGYEHPGYPQMAQMAVEHANKQHSDSGHTINLGIHWQHDLGAAYEHLGATQGEAAMNGRHGERGTPVILEADHPGHEHVVDFTPNPGGGPPEGVNGWHKHMNNRLTGYKKDWALINDTVGPHNMDAWMLPEVPVRPGAPMTIRAVHFPDPENPGEFIRQPLQFRGQA